MRHKETIDTKTITRGNKNVSHYFYTLPVKFRTLLVVAVVVLAVIGVITSSYGAKRVSAACSASCVASMRVSPSSGTYNPGSTVVVSVYVNSGGQSVNAVQADFTYSASRLEFQSINASGSAFAIDASSSGGGGSVSIARGNISAVSGSSLLVAKVTFKVLSSTGAAAINFSSSSTVASSSTNQDILGSTSGASYTVASPAPSPKPSSPPPTTSPTSPAPSENTSTTPSSTPAAPASTPEPTTTETVQPTPAVDETDEIPTPVASTVQKQQTESKPTFVRMAALAGSIIAILVGGGLAVWWFLRYRHSAPSSATPTGFVGPSPTVISPPSESDQPYGAQGDSDDHSINRY